MSDHRSRNQLAMFDEAPGEVPAPRVRPWRSTLADTWVGKAPSDAALEDGTRDLVRRNLEFLRAMEVRGEQAAAGTERFRELHEALLHHVVHWRTAGAGNAERARPVLETARELARLRHEILTSLAPERQRRVMAAEPRVRIKDVQAEQAVKLAEFLMAEERGDVVTVEIPLRDPWRVSAAGGQTAGPDASTPDVAPELSAALGGAFPEGAIEPVWYDEGLDTIHEDVRCKLNELSTAELLYERTLEGDDGRGGGPPGDDFDLEDGPGFDGAGWHDVKRSYALFFLSPRGDEFRYEIAGEFMDEHGRVLETVGVGRIGWALALSGIAPYAVLRVTSLDTEEHLGTVEPDIGPRYFDEDGAPVDAESIFREMVGDQGKERLDDLRRRIEETLARLGISVLSSDELGRAVPWLEADEEVLVGMNPGAPLTVEDALFFCYV